MAARRLTIAGAPFSLTIAKFSAAAYDTQIRYGASSHAAISDAGCTTRIIATMDAHSAATSIS